MEEIGANPSCVVCGDLLESGPNQDAEPIGWTSSPPGDWNSLNGAEITTRKNAGQGFCHE
jgi:hypothetical protein